MKKSTFKRLLTGACLVLLCMASNSVHAQGDYPGVYYEASDNTWHQYADPGPAFYKHPQHSQHFDIFYGTGYGNTRPDQLPASDPLYVDVADLLNKAENFFENYVNRLKFTDLSVSQLRNYRMGIFIIHDTGWLATGAGNTAEVGALWCTPMTMHPVGSTIAHEIGHSFQFQVNCDYGGNTGFRYANGNGSTFWEQTANWQAVVMYPDEMYSTSLGVYRQSHNMAFTHEWHRYQSYWMHFYWCDKYGIDAVGQIWRAGTGWGDDPSTVHRKLRGMSVKELFKEYMEAAMHFVTWDFQNSDWKLRGSYFDIGNFVYDYVMVGKNKFQVSYLSCPQSTGFNVIELQVPAAGTEVTTHFTALTPGCSLAQGDSRRFWNGSFVADINTDHYNTFDGQAYRGFRLGYVALLSNGERIYESPDEVLCTGTNEQTADVSFTVPANVSRLWLVVSPAPTQYITHNWDENILNDDQWPYQVEFVNTSIPGADKYYLYDTVTDRFLSRGGIDGQQAVTDEFGLPVFFTLSNGGQRIQFLDNSWDLGLNGSRVVTNAAPSVFTLKDTDDGTMISIGGKYLTTGSDGSIATTTEEDGAVRWQLLTSTQRNTIIAEHRAAQEREVARLANIGMGKLSLAEHAENDFTAQDMTSRIRNAALGTNTSGWTLTGTAASPESNVMEVYQGTGTTLSQTVTGLPKGMYRVSLYAFYRDGWPAACSSMAGSGFTAVSNAWLEVNGARVQIADWAGQHTGDTYPNFRNEARACFDEGRYRNDVYIFVGDEGRIDISFGSPQYVEGGWFCFANASLTYYGMNDEYEPEYSDIQPDTPEPAERSVAAGKYYFRNRATGLFLTAGNAFSTQASLDHDALDITLSHKRNGQYTFNTRVSNGDGLNFMTQPQGVGGAVYMDGSAFNYAIQPLANGYYLISYLGVSDEGDSKKFYLGAADDAPAAISSRLTNADDPAAQWQILKRAELIEALTEEAIHATEDDPLDVTCLVYAPKFSRNDQRNESSWKGSPVIGGQGDNMCAEKFNCAFDVYQILTGLPAGTYRLEAQGFYRHGLPDAAYTAFRNNAEDGGAVLYGNDDSVPLASIFSETRKAGYPANGTGTWATPSSGYTVPDNMEAASTVFMAGFYQNSIDCHVSDEGRLRIGFKKTAAATPDGNWSIFDNVRLYILQLDEPTAVEEVNSEKGDVKNEAIYDLTGRKLSILNSQLSTLPKGLYIIDGKKVLMR